MLDIEYLIDQYRFDVEKDLYFLKYIMVESKLIFGIKNNVWFIQGGTVVMVGITFEFSRASQDKPNEGRIEATVDG